MAGLLGIGISGLRVNQEALSVIGQNITNASTPGYSRQRVEAEAQVLASTGQSFSGAGVRVDEIARVADEFISRQIRADQSRFSAIDAYSDRLSQVEGLFFSEDSGVDQAISRFFDSMHAANATPGSLPDRQIVITSATSLVERFNAVHSRLEEQIRSADELLRVRLTRVNDLARDIAGINDRLGDVAGSLTKGAANALLDQRDVLLQELSGHLQISTNDAGQGQVNVFYGAGQPLVIGSSSSTFSIRSDGEVLTQTSSSSPATTVTSSLTGGDVGGLLRYRDGDLHEIMNRLGVLAAGMVETVNAAHAEGIDLNGEFGKSFFGDLNAEQLTRLRSTSAFENTGSGQIALKIESASELTASDYTLEFSRTQSNLWQIKRESDGAILEQGALGALPSEVRFDGLLLTFADGSFEAGDRYHLSPARNLAGTMRVALADPSRLALASPVRLATQPSNSGNAALKVLDITDVSNPFFSGKNVTPPLRVSFTSNTTYDVLDNTDPLNPRQLVPPLRNLVYTAGAGQSLLPEDDERLVTMEGATAGALPRSTSIQATANKTGNGYPAGQLVLTEPQASGAAPVLRTAIWDAGASAQEIAGALRSGTGLEAFAYTEVTIKGLTNNGLATDLDVVINGQTFRNPGTLSGLADAISANEILKNQGLVARSDGASIVLTDLHGADINLHVAGDPSDSLTLQDIKGNSLVLNGAGAAGYKSVAVGGVVTVETVGDQRLAGDGKGLFTTAPRHTALSFGFTVGVTGVPKTGDAFTISFNSEARSDNRNGLMMAELNRRPTVGQPPVTYGESFAFLVQTVGNLQNEANAQRDAAEVLLNQSEATRESISGVNLDEEAANLVKFEQAYNASARVISVARDIFDVLFDAVR